MFLAAVLLVTVRCHDALSLEQAKRLVLAAPNIKASIRKRGAKPFFEWIEASPAGWRFDVNSRTPCSHSRACSALLGHYVVNKRTAEVRDLDAGENGVDVSSDEIMRLKQSFRPTECRSHRTARHSSALPHQVPPA